MACSDCGRVRRREDGDLERGDVVDFLGPRAGFGNDVIYMSWSIFVSMHDSEPSAA